MRELMDESMFHTSVSYSLTFLLYTNRRTDDTLRHRGVLHGHRERTIHMQP